MLNTFMASHIDALVAVKKRNEHFRGQKIWKIQSYIRGVLTTTIFTLGKWSRSVIIFLLKNINKFRSL